MENTLRFHIEGMTCSGCARTIRKALEDIPGITALHVVAGEPVEVRLDDTQADREAVEAAVRRAGYRPVLSPSS